MGRITIFSGVERRRRWGDDEKLAMVEASLVPGGSVARIARERDVAPSLIYKWRRRLCGAAGVGPRGFAAVMISPGAPAMSDADTPVLVIEIGGATMRVANNTSPALLVTALRALSR
jgi:transposase